MRPIVQCAAFVASTRLDAHLMGPGRFLSQSFPTQLAVSPVQLTDWTATSLSFFTSIRIPSALIAGASLSSLFTMTKDVDELDEKTSKIEIFLLRVFHGLSLVSLLLSLNCIISTTVAATTLLLGQHNGLAVNAYIFMNREIRYEFVTARWSFFSCLLSFIGSIAVRCFLEFDLLKSKSRRRLALVVGFSTSALLTHLISYINSSLYCWNNLGGMTLDVFRLVLSRAWKSRKMLDLLSSALGLAAVITALLALLPNALVIGDKDADVIEESIDEMLPIVDGQIV